MTDKPDEEKKIFVDEDWKERVQAEKEGAEKKEGEEPSSAPQTSAKTSGDDFPFPPASFEILVSMLATQAMVSLGAVPNPLSGETEVHLGQARHFVDLLSVLDEKTTGNRTAEESAMLEGLLHQLRMAVMEVAKNPAPPSPAADDKPG